MQRRGALQVTINWKFVKFSIWLTDKHIHGLNRMLTSLPQLEELVINIADVLQDLSSAQETYPFVLELQATEEGLYDDMQDSEEDTWRFLKRVTINGIKNSFFAVLVSLTELLLRKALALNELVFHYGLSEECDMTWKELVDLSEPEEQSESEELLEEVCNLTSEELSEFEQRLPTFPKASPHVQIHRIN